MKKKLLILLLIMLLPFMVNAKTKYLYDVIKDEAESNGFAKEYIGEHHDSFTKEPSKKIYHWYAQNTYRAKQILKKNNVIFGDYCWQMFRTTDTGGVKLIYNGLPIDGKCNNTGEDQTIGKSTVNANHYSLADAGYMYNTIYNDSFRSYKTKENIIDSGSLSLDYWYADSYTFNNTNGKYVLINPYKISSTDEYESLVGKYTFLSTNETLSTAPIKYIVKSYSSGNVYFINAYLGHDENYYNYKYAYGDSYTDNGDGTYTINNGNIMMAADMVDNYHNLEGRFYCKLSDGTNLCSNIRYGLSASSSFVYYINPQNNYKFASGFTYNNGVYTLNDDSITIWNLNWPNTPLLSTHHYTCWNTSGECNRISYFHYIGYNYYTYIEMENGNDINKIVNDMLYADNVNKYNSQLKAYIDNWYQENMTDYTDYIEDTIYCNNRTASNTNEYGLNPNGGSVQNHILFNVDDSLKCKNDTDKFSLSNPKAKLDYPVGLMTYKEAKLLGDETVNSTGEGYWLMSPYDVDSTMGSLIYYSNVWSTGHPGVGRIIDSSGVRPVISLIPKSRFSTGTGTKDDPYIVDFNTYYSVIVIDEKETKEINVDLEDINTVEAGKTVRFTIVPQKGYMLDNIIITDEEENDVEYHKTNKTNEYEFTMPETDVIIKPIYKRINTNNPKTGINYLFTLLLIIIISGITYLIKKKKRLV